MRRSVIRSSVLVAAFGLAACSEPMTEPSPVAIDPMSSSLSDGAENVVDRGSAVMPGGLFNDHDMLEICEGAINGSQYVCPPSTPVIDFYLDEFYGALAAERTNTLNLYNLAADLVVTYHTLLYADAYGAADVRLQRRVHRGDARDRA